MKKTMISALLLSAAFALANKEALPPAKSEIEGDWFGNVGAETFYLKLDKNASGKSIYILGNSKDGAVSIINKWDLNGHQISMSCTGVTYPNENYAITGSVSSWEMNIEVNGKNENSTWTRKLRLRPVKDVEREIELGKKATRD